MKIKFLPIFLTFGLTLSTFTNAIAQQYSQPSQTNPEWAHANTQCLYSVNIKSGENVLLDYQDTQTNYAYNWLQDEKIINVNPGQTLTIDTRAGIWAWDIELGFDWDADGSFETLYRAFCPIDKEMSQANCSWGVSPWKDAEYRKAEKEKIGNSGVLHYVFTVKVPENAKVGKSRLRVLSDGDGYKVGGVPPFDINGNVGYAGSMTDFGINVTKPDNTTTAINNIKDVFKSKDKTNIYTLNGIKINKSFNELPSGIYIVNGKKIVK